MCSMDKLLFLLGRFLILLLFLLVTVPDTLLRQHNPINDECSLRRKFIIRSLKHSLCRTGNSPVRITIPTTVSRLQQLLTLLLKFRL